MINTITVQMKSLNDIMATLNNVRDWDDYIECNIESHEEVINIPDGMLGAIAGKTLEVFEYPFQTYDYNYWHEEETNDDTHNYWINLHILKEWVVGD